MNINLAYAGRRAAVSGLFRRVRGACGQTVIPHPGTLVRARHEPPCVVAGYVRSDVERRGRTGRCVQRGHGGKPDCTHAAADAGRRGCGGIRASAGTHAQPAGAYPGYAAQGGRHGAGAGRGAYLAGWRQFHGHQLRQGYRMALGWTKNRESGILWGQYGGWWNWPCPTCGITTA